MSITKIEPEQIDASGHSQHSRGLTQLSADYFSLQERSLSGWFAYMRTFATKINFFDVSSQKSTGNWQDALPNDEQAEALQALFEGQVVSDDIKVLAARPDIASLLAFFTMMQYPFALFTRFTARHQQYYYRNVLGFKNQSALADKSHLVVTLSNDVDSMTLLQGTQFDGGTDQAGNALVYQSQKNTLLNHASVDKVMTLSKNKNDDKLLLRSCLDSDIGTEIPEQGVLTFGEDNTDHQPEDVGFTLSSALLYLSGGTRTLDIDFNLKVANTFPGFALLDYFDVFLSSSELMIPLTVDTPFCTVENSQTGIVIVLERLFPAVATFRDDSLSEQAQAILPATPHLSFIIKSSLYSEESKDKSVFSLLRKGLFNNIALTVNVVGVSGIIANNNNGALDTTSPFTPFDHEPRIASKFEFTHPELLVKQVTSASLSFNWLGRPLDWDSYYQAYITYRNSKSTTETEGEVATWASNQLDILHSDKLVNVFDKQAMFSRASPVNNIDHYELDFIIDEQNNGYDHGQLPLDTAEANQWPKWFSLVLTNNDFGHGEYSQVVQYAAYLNLNDDLLLTAPIEVQAPYTPLLDSLLLNYNSKVEFTLEQAAGENKLQHIHPLGRPIIQGENGIALLPKFNALGYLYIGLSQVIAPGQFSLYIELDPVDGSNITNTPEVDWHYLSDSGWTFFDKSDADSARIIEDSTYKLLDSGVITFELPEMAIGTNFTGDDRFWIRLSIAETAINETNNDALHYALYSRILAIYAQGIEVELLGLENDPSHFNSPLAAESITDLVQPESNIDSVLQPYSSFGGRYAELDSVLAIRASERLRHKNRAVTAWDYEHLILAKFPELFQVRCFKNTSESELQQAKVALVAVPVNHNSDILQPKVPLYLKRKIERYLEQVSPLAVTTEVLDPSYEQVELEIFAKISSDYDIESIEGELNKIIIDYMTPWNDAQLFNLSLSSQPVTQVLEKEIYLTELTAVLERHVALEKIYVMRASQYLANDEIKQYSGKEKSDNKITPSKSESILVPALIHNITLFNTDITIFEGIEKWRIELDFKVS